MDNYNNLSWGHFKQLDSMKGGELKIVFSQFDRCILYTIADIRNSEFKKTKQQREVLGSPLLMKNVICCTQTNAYKEKLCMTF